MLLNWPLCLHGTEQAIFNANHPVLYGLFLAGLVGSLSHCVGMCGPFVMGQIAARLNAVPVEAKMSFQRLTGMALFPYHLGRVTSYACIGAMAGGLAEPLRTMPWFKNMVFGMLLVGGCLFLGAAFHAYPLGGGGNKLTEFLLSSRRIKRLSQSLFASPIGWRGYGLGLCLGFLPCGLVYAAVIASASQGGVLFSSLGMVLFGLGTMPALVALGLGGQSVLNRFRPFFRWAFPVVMIVNACILFAMAGGFI